jgi:hypothetical protein
MVLRTLLAIVALLLGLARQAAAQTPFDSLAVLRALATKLRADARTVVQRFACYDGMHPCATESAETPHPLLRAFADEAGAQLVNATRASIPPCPWGWEQPPAPAGYRLGIARITIRSDTAHVLVLRHCENPPGARHRIFGQDDEYELVRDAEGVWHLRRERMLRITRRLLHLERATPGAELAVATDRRDVQGSHQD